VRRRRLPPGERRYLPPGMALRQHVALTRSSALPRPGSQVEELFITNGEVDRQKGKAVYFMRVNEGSAVSLGTVEQEIVYGVVGPSALETLQANMSELFMPLVTQASGSWERTITEEASGEFFGTLGKFHLTLNDAVNSLQGGFTLRKPEKMFDIENKAAALNRAGAEPEIVTMFESVVEDWCKGTERLLSESDANRQESDDAGPETELEYWRTRMAKFNSITEQLKGRDCKVRPAPCPRLATPHTAHAALRPPPLPCSRCGSFGLRVARGAGKRRRVNRCQPEGDAWLDPRCCCCCCCCCAADTLHGRCRCETRRACALLTWCRRVCVCVAGGAGRAERRQVARAQAVEAARQLDHRREQRGEGQRQVPLDAREVH
tara:strand:+ start:200 stop:1330 length:1131 start_codon:yes stop_codon:yes gene_type:complete